MYECFHCGCRTVIWDADFDFEDMGYDGGGAFIEYRVRTDGEEED